MLKDAAFGHCGHVEAFLIMRYHASAEPKNYPAHIMPAANTVNPATAPQAQPAPDVALHKSCIDVFCAKKRS